MNQLNTVTQHNASASEELASTSEELSAQALGLQNAIGFFHNLGELSQIKFEQTPSIRLNGRNALLNHAPSKAGQSLRTGETNFRPY
jgi:hypothetical protein